MALINKDTIEQDNSDELYQKALALTPAQRNAELAKIRKEKLMSIVGNVGTGAQQFFQNRKQFGFDPSSGRPIEFGADKEITINKGSNDLNDFIAKEMIRKQMEGDPLEKFKQEQTIKAEIDAQDPLKQAQIKALETVAGGGGEGSQFRPESVTVAGQTFKRVPTEEEKNKEAEDEAKQLEKKERIKQVSKARKDLDTYTSDAMQSLTAIDKLESEAKNLPAFERGLLPQISAKAQIGYGKFTKDKNISRYLGVVAQELIPAARKIMEEKGPITEFDVDRVEKGLGDIYAPLEDKVFLLNELRNKIKQAIQNKIQVAELSDEEFMNKYTKLYLKAFGGDTALPTNASTGQGQIMIDAQGNKAMVYPDGRIEEVQ